MSIQEQKAAFEANKVIYESVLLTFKGVDGWDVYNCSVPFTYQGKTYIYGRVERREEWANSHMRIFEKTGKDEYTVVPDKTWELEDPYIQKVNNEMILGGTHVRKNSGDVLSYYGFFYRGTPFDVSYFTSGPDYMKDIRIVTLADGRLGVFSRRRVDFEADIGFTIINNVDELSMESIAAAQRIDVLTPKTWGGVNQAYLLTSGMVGCIAHYSYKDTDPTGNSLLVYVNYSFVMDPATRAVMDGKIIGTRSCYPSCPSKVPNLADCVFTSGMTMREDGKCDLYSGSGDTCEGRITIDYPFEGHGDVTGDFDF